MHFAILDNVRSFWLTCLATNSTYMIFEWKFTIYIYIPKHFSQFLSMMTFLKFPDTGRRNKQMTCRGIFFQVVETESFKHSFYSYFKVLHGFIMYMSTFVRIGIMSKIWKVRTIVFKKQIKKIYFTQQRHKYRSLRYTINNV